MKLFRFKQTASLLCAGAALVLFQVAAVQKAYAHHPIVQSATAACVNNAPVITFTVAAWNPGSDANGQRDNPEVQVFFNGGMTPVFTGAFLPGTVPPDQFTNSAPAPAGTDTVVVSAVAAGTWGDKYPGGQDSNDTNNSITVTLPANCSPPGNGRFTGGGKQVVVNAIVPASGVVTVTKGFEVDCDLDPTHQNLELNWTGANNFHMNTITGATCTWTGPPNPPTAMVNKIVATGTGKFNNQTGYSIMFTLIDNGEPGTSDAGGFIVYETANPSHVVLSVPTQTVTTGNIQAHIDQK